MQLPQSGGDAAGDVFLVGQVDTNTIGTVSTSALYLFGWETSAPIVSAVHITGVDLVQHQNGGRGQPPVSRRVVFDVTAGSILGSIRRVTWAFGDGAARCRESHQTHLSAPGPLPRHCHRRRFGRPRTIGDADHSPDPLARLPTDDPRRTGCGG
jgi:hypothetical protein